MGVSAARQYAALDVGDTVQARTATLEVVGHFVAEGTAAESEIWMDRAIAQSVFRRTATVSVARVKLAPDVEVKALNQRLAADPRLSGTLIPEQEFFAGQSASRAALIDAFAYLIAGIMALGSVFGALATMFTAVSRRSVEIATLRALGFHAVPVVISVLVEATVLALAGGILGAAVAYAVLDGYTASTLNPAAGSQLAFAFRVTPESIWLGLGWAIALGVVGGTAPAMRAARLPITTVLRGPECSHRGSSRQHNDRHHRGNPWGSGRKPLTSDDGPVTKGFHEHPRVTVTIPCAILIRILRNHLSRLRTLRTYGPLSDPWPPDGGACSARKWAL